MFNNPHNPSARMFGEAELALLAEACVRHDAVAISDEVWEHVVFDGRRHLPLSALPGMAGRTVKIGSAGKIFSLTGWKVGWAVAAPPLAATVANAHQFVTFATAPNLQSAVAYGLGKDDAYSVDAVRLRCCPRQARRRLADAGYAVLPAEGTYLRLGRPGRSGIGAGDVDFASAPSARRASPPSHLFSFYAERPVTKSSASASQAARDARRRDRAVRAAKDLFRS